MPQAASIWVKLGFKAEDFNKGLAKLEKSTARLGSKLSSVGSAMTQSLTLPIAAFGVAAVKSADDLNKAYGTIRAGTGALGKDLENLKTNFRTTFKAVPDSADAVSSALADLNTRTGLTGKSLTKLSTQMLNLARIQKTDVNQTITTSTRLFGDWSISSGNAAKSMDYLFRVSQATGPSVEEIGRLMVQYGAPLRQMGFSFEQTALLMGKFQKEGVNTELVMSSMRQGLAKFARAGEEPAEALQRVIGEIKNTGSVAQANVKAIEIFGARSGPDLAAAVREGRFNIQELANTIAKSKDTINGTTAVTETFGDKLGKLRNQAMIAFEPLGKSLIDSLTKLIPALQGIMGAIASLGAAFAALPSGVQQIIISMVALAAAAGPVISVAGNMMKGFSALFGIIKLFKAGGIITSVASGFMKLTSVILALNPATLIIIGGLAALTAAIYLVYKNWDKVKADFVEAGNTIKAIWNGVLNFFRRVVPAGLKIVVNAVWSAVDRIRNAFGSLPGFFKSMWSSILSFITKLPGTLYAKAKSIASSFWNGFKKGLGIKSPSYVEKAFMAMPDRAKASLQDLKKLAPQIEKAASIRPTALAGVPGALSAVAGAKLPAPAITTAATAALKPIEAVIGGGTGMSIKDSSFTIVANNPAQLFEEMKKLQNKANLKRNASIIDIASPYGSTV